MIQCGSDGDIPMVRNYFQDGNRLSVFRPSNGNWYIKGVGQDDWADSYGNLTIQCGTKGDIPIPGDYFVEMRSRLAVFRPSEGNWYIKGPGENNWSDTKVGNVVMQFGTKDDIPVLSKIVFGQQFNSHKDLMF